MVILQTGVIGICTCVWSIIFRYIVLTEMYGYVKCQVRSLEAQGLPSKQAEAITGAITEVLNDSLGVVSQLVVCKGEMQKVFSFNLN